MKKITCILLFSLNIGYAQIFDAESDQNSTQNQFFQEHQPVSEPEQVNDATGEPPPADPEAPIDQWLFGLSMVGIGVGMYFLSRKKKLA